MSHILQTGSKLRPKVLQHVAVPVIENQVCESWHRRKGIDIRIYDEMMCAGYEMGQRDACQVSLVESVLCIADLNIPFFKVETNVPLQQNVESINTTIKLLLMRTNTQGDSGGPLMLNQFGVWYLVGIVSAGYSCAKQYQPGIYHRVSFTSM